MKLGSLLSRNRYKIKPKSSKRLAGGCYGRRTKPGGMTTTTKRGVVSVPRGWFAVVKKKFQVTPHNKNIIIIHNNTSIASNDEDVRASSCVDPTKDHQIAKSKDVVQEKSSATTTTTTHNVATHNVVDLKEEDSSSSGVVEDKSSTSATTTSTTTTITTDENKTRDDDGSLGKSEDGDVNVEKLTLGNKKNEEEKAIKIQAAFRGHLARRAFRALKSLVKLQAVVRGVVVRSQARMALHCMRALVRLGDRVRARQLLTRSTDD